MFLNVILWPFKKIFQLERFILDCLRRVYKFLDRPIGKDVISKKEDEAPIMLVDFESTEIVRYKTKKRFTYVVKDTEGKKIRGTFDAYSKIDVHSFLLSQGYEVYKISEDKLSNAFGLAEIKSKSKLRPKTLAFFLTQLSTYIKAGITLVDSIKILSRQTKKQNEKKIYQRIVYELNAGVNFSEALAKQGESFPKLLINMVKTAEMTGQLTDALDDMADYYTSMDATRKQIISALTYPSAIFVLAIAVVSFMILYVVPQFTGIYSQANAELPGITQFVIGVSDFFEKNIIIVALSVVTIIIMIVTLYKNVASVRYILQWIGMHVPVFKSIIIYSQVIMFTKTFASLINHDVFITDSMEILGRITNNEIYKSLVKDAVTNLSEGKELSLAFKNQWAFPTTAYEMLVTGEKTGRMGEMMDNVAKYYQEQQKTLVTQLKSLIEPIMIVFLAGIVGLIVLSIVIPMFDMYQQIG